MIESGTRELFVCATAAQARAPRVGATVTLYLDALNQIEYQIIWPRHILRSLFLPPNLVRSTWQFQIRAGIQPLCLT